MRFPPIVLTAALVSNFASLATADDTIRYLSTPVQADGNANTPAIPPSRDPILDTVRESLARLRETSQERRRALQDELSRLDVEEEAMRRIEGSSPRTSVTVAPPTTDTSTPSLTATPMPPPPTASVTPQVIAPTPEAPAQRVLPTVVPPIAPSTPTAVPSAPTAVVPPARLGLSLPSAVPNVEDALATFARDETKAFIDEMFGSWTIRGYLLDGGSRVQCAMERASSSGAPFAYMVQASATELGGVSNGAFLLMTRTEEGSQMTARLRFDASVLMTINSQVRDQAIEMNFPADPQGTRRMHAVFRNANNLHLSDANRAGPGTTVSLRGSAYAADRVMECVREGVQRAAAELRARGGTTTPAAVLPVTPAR